jgi:peptide/nickel transport system substrate-binding protein
MKRVLVFLVFLGILVLLIAGCSSTPSNATTPAAAQPPASKTATAQYGGVLKIISGMGPVAFGYPPKSNPMDGPGFSGVLESLIGVDKVGEPTPLLATGWSVSDDGKSVTFNLHKGVKFHDGSDFNAAAVKWNMDLDMEAKLITTVTSVDVIDDYTVKYNLPQYSSVVFTQVSDIVFISPTAVAKNGVDWAKTNAVGTGPFMQKEFKRDVSVTKVKFDGYWNKGLPYLDGMSNVFIPDTTSAKISFEAGEASILMMGSDGKGARELADKGFNVRAFDGMSSFFVYDSANQNFPFSKLKVRQALDYAINKKAICDTVGAGYMHPINQIAPAGFIGNNPAIQDRAFDPAKAKQLLSEAGYPNGFQTKLMGMQAFTNPDIVTAIQSYLKDVGIDVTVDMMDMGRGFGLRMTGWENGMMFAGTGLDPNLCQRLAVDLGTDTPVFPNLTRPAQWKPVLDQAGAARDIKDREKYLQQLMKIAVDDMFVVPLYTTADIAAMQKNVNCGLLLMHHIKWNPADAWLSK